ncbi:hypothetical protein H8K38_06230 [Undibacterium sp. FT79W]|uniref:hypothetical protein n=1 Tax=Undibacterium sp. FT79W TaxID=2762296 RepID=UPI00164B9EC2|nr:hypothetical protein [Undibacterium sp. FT79W]MBC3877397.1 hypothetical protein [Undibacterium sp. FT79W]
MTITIRNLSELTLSEIVASKDYDLFFGFLCHESRSIHILKRTHDKCSKRVMFIESSNDAPATQTPHQTWARKALTVSLPIKDGALADDSLELHVHNLLKTCTSNEPLRVLLDISSMPRCVMAALIAAFEDLPSSYTSIEITVAYCLAKYVPPPSNHVSNKVAKPVHANFTGFATDPGLPVASIVGLGYEKGKALGAVEYLQSADWWVFVPTSEEAKYLRKVEMHNATILNGVRDQQRFEYSVHSPLNVLTLLESLVASLVRTHKPVLLPFGPKIFFFCALLTALVHKRCAVWDVSGDNEPVRTDVTPSPYVMCMQFDFIRS